ncbi:hypothetical protein [Petrotoga sp. DB-2]|jgi:hypothetical protein
MKNMNVKFYGITTEKFIRTTALRYIMIILKFYESQSCIKKNKTFIEIGKR